MYKIKNEANGVCEIFLYSFVENGWTAQRLLSQIQATPNITSIVFRINSEGGDVFEGLSIYNYIKSLNVPVDVYIDGVAASVASVIACCGTVHMPQNAMMMLHNPWGGVQGESDELRTIADVLDKIRDSTAEIYAAKCGRSVDEMKDLMAKETWLSASEAKELGLCDVVQEVAAAPEHVAPATEDAVKAERERLQELDALMTPERRGLIDKAKYETYQSAKDIALELLKLQARSEDSKELSGIAASVRLEDDGTRSIAEIINQKRGYNNGR